MHTHQALPVWTCIILQLPVSIITSCRQSKWKDVDSCPRNTAEWNNASKRLNCSSEDQSCVYHCLPNEYQNSTVEGCSKAENIIGQYCAEYNVRGKKIQEDYDRSCGKDICPCPTIYMSNETYKYTSCLTKGLPTCLPANMSDLGYFETRKGEVAKMVWMCLCLVQIPIILILVITVLRLRNNRDNKTPYDKLPLKDETQAFIETSAEQIKTSAQSDETQAFTEASAEQIKTSAKSDETQAFTEASAEQIKTSAKSGGSGVSEESDYRSVSKEEVIESLERPHSHTSLSSVPSTFSSPENRFLVVIGIGRQYTGYVIVVNSSNDRLHLGTSKLLSALMLRKGTLMKKSPKQPLFGLEARNAYAKLNNDERKRYWFFHDFSIQSNNGKFNVKDIEGTAVDANIVLRQFLKCLKRITLHRIKEKKGEPNVENTKYILVSKVLDIHVLTEAANQVFDVNNLEIIEEADSYSTCLTHVRESFKCFNGSICDISITKNEMYIVVDLGEDGANIAMNKNLDLKSTRDETIIHRRLSWKSACVTARIMRYIFFGLLGEDCMKKLMEEHYDKYVDILKQIETQKGYISQGDDNELLFHLPRELDEIEMSLASSSLRHCVENSTSEITEYVVINDQGPGDIELKLRKEVVPYLLEKSTRKLFKVFEKNDVKHRFREAKLMYLIGGYANFKQIQEQMVNHFKEIAVIVPTSPEFAVLKGIAFNRGE